MFCRVILQSVAVISLILPLRHKGVRARPYKILCAQQAEHHFFACNPVRKWVDDVFCNSVEPSMPDIYQHFADEVRRVRKNNKRKGGIRIASDS